MRLLGVKTTLYTAQGLQTREEPYTFASFFHGIDFIKLQVGRRDDGRLCF